MSTTTKTKHMEATMGIGTRVRLSGYALQSARDYWQGLGDYTRKNAAKREYDRQLAQRGTVSAIIPHGFEVRWDDGTVSKSIAYHIEADHGARF